jgi:hypothetical protein
MIFDPQKIQKMTAGDTISLESIEFECPIEVLYEGVSLDLI